jgi:hypothetical protein
MIFKNNAPVERINKTISYKLCNLLSFLKQATSEYEKVAEEIENKDLRMALRSIAVETNQYANELSAQLKCFDIPHLSSLPKFNDYEVLEYIHSITTPAEGNNLSAICNESEHFLIGAYRDVLNEYIPFPFLKEIIATQLNGIKGAFMKIKLLDFIRFN